MLLPTNIIAVLNSIYRFENVKIDESRFETLYPIPFIPYTLHPKKDPNLSLFRRSACIKCHVKILRVHVMCALFRIAAPMGTSGLRAGSPSRANGHIPRAPAAARCVHVLPAFSTQILNYLHHPSVPDQYASNIREQLYVRSGLSVTPLATVSSCSKEHPPRSTGSGSLRRIFGHGFGG